MFCQIPRSIAHVSDKVVVWTIIIDLYCSKVRMSEPCCRCDRLFVMLADQFADQSIVNLWSWSTVHFVLSTIMALYSYRTHWCFSINCCAIHRQTCYPSWEWLRMISLKLQQWAQPCQQSSVNRYMLILTQTIRKQISCQIFTKTERDNPKQRCGDQLSPIIPWRRITLLTGTVLRLWKERETIKLGA